jgi:hypothetical protein
MIPHKPFDGAAGTCPNTKRGVKNKKVNNTLSNFVIIIVFKG